MQKITPFLWFDNNAEDAINFYTSVFKDSSIGQKHMMGDKLLTATFYLNGQEFMVLNGGPMFQFTEAISLFVKCETQEEVDYYWDTLTADGGQESRCGWLKDKYGLSWQIVPTGMVNYLWSSDKEASGRAMQAMMQMNKLDLAVLKNAYDNA